jgi:hypothetical protein
MQTLGDVMQLQRMEMDKLKALAMHIDPPMNVPSNLLGTLRLYPGAQNPVSAKDNEQIKPTLAVNHEIERIGREIQNVEARIKEGFFNDLFLMMTTQERSGTTAFEIAKKNEEKLVLLGPVVERQNNEMLSPTIDRTFEICQRAGLIPPPPKELQDLHEDEIRIEYVSLLAQAQKMVGVTGIERTVSFIGNLMQAYPQLRHKFEAMKIADEYADLSGMSPKLIRSDEEAMRLFNDEQKQMQQAQQQAQLSQTAATAKDLSGIKLGDGSSALDRVIGQLPAV